MTLLMLKTLPKTAIIQKISTLEETYQTKPSKRYFYKRLPKSLVKNNIINTPFNLVQHLANAYHSTLQQFIFIPTEINDQKIQQIFGGVLLNQEYFQMPKVNKFAGFSVNNVLLCICFIMFDGLF